MSTPHNEKCGRDIGDEQIYLSLRASRSSLFLSGLPALELDEHPVSVIRIHGQMNPRSDFDSAFVLRDDVPELVEVRLPIPKPVHPVAVSWFQSDERCLSAALFFLVSGSHPRVPSALRSISRRASGSLRR
jgi:hypothetical protein